MGCDKKQFLKLFDEELKNWLNKLKGVGPFLFSAEQETDIDFSRLLENKKYVR